MALTAQLNLEELPGRAGSKGITAGTNNLGIGKILGMNLILHNQLAGVNANLPSILAGRLKFNNTINQSKEGKILTNTDIIARVNARAPLPNQNSPGVNTLPGVSLYSQPLRLAIPTVPAGAAPLFMCHFESPLSGVCLLSPAA